LAAITCIKALQAREDRRVQFLGQRLVVGQNQPATRTAQRLVRGGGGDMRMRHRRSMNAAGHEAREMRHVDQEIGADAVGDFAKALEIPGARIGGAAGDDQLRLDLLGLLGHRVHVDDLVLAPHRVVRGLEPFAGHVDRRTVGEMSAGGEIETHEGIAGLQQRQEYRLVHLAARIRLHVCESRAEQFLGALDRQRLRDVDPFAAAVIAMARITLGVFVGHHRALRFQHGAADDVLRSNQLNLMTLPAEFAADRGRDLRIGLGERGGKERVGRGFGAAGRRAHE
jgi:hypothetical protein